MSSWTCCLFFFMLDMFDKTRSGQIDLFGFSALWDFMQRWRALFQQYDRDHSGTISGAELHQGDKLLHLTLVLVCDKLMWLAAKTNHDERNLWFSTFCSEALIHTYFASSCFPQPWLRWVTTSAPSSLRLWCGASPYQACDLASSWTASFRCAPSSRPWRRSSERGTLTWRATSASTMRISSLEPSPGSCEPTDNLSALWTQYYYMS